MLCRLGLADAQAAGPSAPRSAPRLDQRGRPNRHRPQDRAQGLAGNKAAHRASLAALAGAKARDAIRRVEHPEIRKSLSSLPPASGHVLVETIVPPRRPEQSRYTLTRMHARGGLQGRVWLAHDGDLRREVALKEILPEQAATRETWRRFLKEAQVTGQLEHPNIVPVYELAPAREDDQPFYVMRFVRGQSLLDALRDFHRDRAGNAPELLALQGLLAAFLKVCDAVAYAPTARGVVHRDLKPENIVLGVFGEVIVLDWGLAKLVDQPDDPGELGTRSLDRISLADDARTERTQGQMGTPCYMAPEQVDLKHDLVDDRTDVLISSAASSSKSSPDTRPPRGRPPPKSSSGSRREESLWPASSSPAFRRPWRPSAPRR